VVGEHFSGATTILRIRLDQAEVTISAMLVSRNVQMKVGDGVGVIIDPDEVLLDSQV
jgi:hypothetical protein